MLTVLLVSIGAALGAPTRFLVDRYLNGTWPRGTLLVNLAGSLVLGIAVGYSLNDPPSSAAMLALIGTGFCGALTTFGGFAAQTIDLIQLGRLGSTKAIRVAVLYASGSVVGCVAVAWIGLITGLQL